MIRDIQNIEKNNQEDTKKNKNILFIVLKKHKIALFFLLFFAFASTSFAWFIYNKTVAASIHAHVKSWDVVLGDGEADAYEFHIADLYPGMPDNTDSIDIVNNGEIDGDLEISVKSITLFGELQSEDTYTVTTSDDGTTFVVEGYPFDLHFEVDGTTVAAGGKVALSFSLTWDYENDDPTCLVTDENGTYNQCDMEDTALGEKSYAFSSNPDNEDLSSLVIELTIAITQNTNP